MWMRTNFFYFCLNFGRAGQVKQIRLPPGPVFMSPTRLLHSLNREVILRNPEEFKVACLLDIVDLFEDKRPFYAGFGNRKSVRSFGL
jgi:phosphatidate phosphatase PAH1